MAVSFAGCSAATSPPPVAKAALTTSVPASQPATTETASAVTEPEKPASGETQGVEITIKEMDWGGLEKLVASHKGKVVVVDIWSTSCEPCLRELPHLVTMQKRHPDDVVCISFDCDYDGRKSKPVEYWRERVITNLSNIKADSVINVMCTVAADELFQQINLESIPAVCVYDRNGKLAKRFDNTTPAPGEEGISYKVQIDPFVAELVKAEQN